LFYYCSILPFCSGPTPIAPVLRRVLRDKQHEIEERKLLILLATDGVPTDSQGHRDIRSLEYILKNERRPTNRIPVTIIACTGNDTIDDNQLIDIQSCCCCCCSIDDNDCIGYLNNWDKVLPNLDVVDDYRSERKEIQARQGKEFPFSFGDVCHHEMTYHVFTYMASSLFSTSLRFSWVVSIRGSTISMKEK
jgi:hypothetical protein